MPSRIASNTIRWLAESCFKDRLESGGYECMEIDHGYCYSIYFHDPNGIALEASWWPVGADALAFDPGDPELFADPNPVPAVNELAGDGLSSVPTTHLR